MARLRIFSHDRSLFTTLTAEVFLPVLTQFSVDPTSVSEDGANSPTVVNTSISGLLGIWERLSFA